MMKISKIILQILFIVILSISLSACSNNSGSSDMVTYPSVESDVGSTDEFNPTETTYTQNSVCVDITDEYYGQFATWADITIYWNEDADGSCSEINYILVNDPTLLAFQIDDRHAGGLGEITGAEVEFLLSSLQEYAKNTEMSAEDAEMFRQVLALLSSIGCCEGAST